MFHQLGETTQSVGETGRQWGVSGFSEASSLIGAEGTVPSRKHLSSAYCVYYLHFDFSGLGRCS